MSLLLETIRGAGEPFGLNLVAAVPVNRYDAVVTEPYRAAALDAKAKSIVVIANGGGALWGALQRHAQHNRGWWKREHPLDDFTRAIVEKEIAPVVRQSGARSTIIFPFMNGTATLNFIELGKVAGLAGPSILGVVVHPKFGPWIAFRAAILVDELIDAPGEAGGFDPCPTCTERSCIAACPAAAVAFPSGWDIPRCLAYRIESEPDCTPRCHARVACVLGPEHRYPEEELAYHQKRALAAMRPWYEKNLKPAGHRDIE
jgi:epoxyqueuosine reductase